MSLEQQITELNETLKNLPAAIAAAIANAAPAAAPAAEPTKRTRKSKDDAGEAGTKTEPQTDAKDETTQTKTDTAASKGAITPEMAQAALIKIKDEWGIDDARRVLKEFGYTKMSEITADKAAEVLEAAVKHEAWLVGQQKNGYQNGQKLDMSKSNEELIDEMAAHDKANPTPEMAQAALVRIKDGHGIEKAREVLKQFGYTKMSEITADKAGEVLEAAIKRELELAAGGKQDAESDL